MSERSLERALNCGLGGRDGAYLAQLLLDKGCVVIDSSRDATSVSLLGLKLLEVRGAGTTVNTSR